MGLPTLPITLWARCQELEQMAEQQLQTINQVYLADVQRLRAANSSLLEEVNLAGERLTRCQRETEVREAMLRDGGTKTAGLMGELNELRDFKVRFEAWVNERLTAEKAAMAAAQDKILSLEKEVDDLHAREAVQEAAIYEIR